MSVDPQASSPLRGAEILRLCPTLRDAYGWVPLAQGPTPVQRARALGSAVGCEGLWIKREDQSALLHGGNKVRKLEWLLGDALRRRARAVLTLGAVGSNHVLACSLFAKRLGLRCHAAVLPQPEHPYVARNLAAALASGCDVRFGADERQAVKRMAQLYATIWRRDGVRPYTVLPGGSSPRGALGHVDEGLEIARQVKDGELPEPAFLFVPVGSCGTLAGLLLGLRIAGLRTVPVGVRVYERSIANERVVMGLALGARSLLARVEPAFGRVRLRRRDVLVLHDHAGEGYGHPTAEGARAAAAAAELAGLTLELTYGAKALAGLAAFMSAPERRGATALFVHTFNSRPLDSIAAECPPRETVPEPLRRYLPRE